MDITSLHNSDLKRYSGSKQFHRYVLSKFIVYLHYYFEFFSLNQSIIVLL